MEYPYCAVKYARGNIIFESVKATGLTLNQVIENDKNYGIMVPANGKYFTYAVFNDDTEFTEKQALTGAAHAHNRWRTYATVPRFRRVKKDFKGIIDFRIEFRTVESDPDKKLTTNTIMYHYYPINQLDHPLRGLCVVNKAFFFTSHGNPVSGHFMIDKGTNVSFPDGSYRTLDFDTIYGHEQGHGLGLPHDPEEDNIMSYRADLMTEFPSPRDIARIRAKYGTRSWTSRRLARWLRILAYISDR